MSRNPGVEVEINGVSHILKFRPRGWAEFERMFGVRPYARLLTEFGQHIGMDLVLCGYYAGLIHDSRFRALKKDAALDQLEKHIENNDLSELAVPLQKAMLLGIGLTEEDLEKALASSEEAAEETPDQGNAVAGE